MDEWRELKSVLKALGGLARLAIVSHLARAQEVTVTELTDTLGISQPLVSWHLRKLRRAGIISSRRTGGHSYYALNPQRIQESMHRLGQLIDPTFELGSFPIGEALLEAEVGLDEE